MTTFHDPSLRNEGTNLQKTKIRVRHLCGGTSLKLALSTYLYLTLWIALNYIYFLNKQVCWGGGEGEVDTESLPFVESCWPLLCHHGPSAVDGTLVLAWW